MNAEVSAFNPELFLNTQVSEANSTELLLVDEGEYIAFTDPITAESFKSFDISKGDRAGSKGYRVDVMWNINDESGAIKEKIGRQPKVKQGLMLDLRSDGTIETGKGRNVGLGRLRSAFNQNGDGRPWSFSMLGGQTARIKVKHRLDPKTQVTYAEVVDVAKL